MITPNKRYTETEPDIKIINMNGDRAEIVIRYTNEDGQRVSFTRHVHANGDQWVGYSTSSRRKVAYTLPDSALAEAA